MKNRNNNFNEKSAAYEAANSQDNTKFWIADLFQRNTVYYESKKDFIQACNELDENKVQYTYNEPS